MTQDTPKSSIFARLDTDLLRETGKASRAIPPEKMHEEEPKAKNAPPKIPRDAQRATTTLARCASGSCCASCGRTSILERCQDLSLY